MTSIPLVLRLNSASCIGFGIAFVLVSDRIAEALGTIPPVVLTVLGAALILNGAHLLLASWRSTPKAAEVVWFSLGDLLWWLGTLALIAAGFWITTPMGIALAFLVAMGVASLGATQLFLLGRHRSGLSTQAHWRRIGRSWLSLPLWVKVWLFALNAVFLVAPAVLPWELASVILIAYVASGPLLLGFAAYEGGLTRALGIAHLVPWLPLLLWLFAIATAGDIAPMALMYVWLLAAVTAICLAFDVYDVVRWIRGERAILL